MTRPDFPDVLTTAEDIGCKLLDSPWTLRVLLILITFAFGFLLGVEAVRAVI